MTDLLYLLSASIVAMCAFGAVVGLLYWAVRRVK